MFPLDLLDTAERQTEILMALDKLSEADQAVLVLRCFDQLPFAEIGASLDIPETTARRRCPRLRRLENRCSRSSRPRAGLLEAPACRGPRVAARGASRRGTGFVSRLYGCLRRPARERTSLAFDSAAKGPFFLAAYRRREASWAVSLSGMRTGVVVEENGRRSAPNAPGSLIVDKEGHPVAIEGIADLPADDSWKGAPEAWPT